MAAARRSLPAWSYRSAIVDAIRGHDVTIVRGMTGSGKSTQVPQFVLEDAAPGAPVHVVVTQPRRIAAVSVATRVAAERGERVGGSIGYRIRGESAVSTATRVTFVTTGVLLRQLSSYRASPSGGGKAGAGGGAAGWEDLLDGTTHVVVDEVHERAVDTDLILLLLRDALAARATRAKVVLMSATVDAVKLGSYFSAAASVGTAAAGAAAVVTSADAASVADAVGTCAADAAHVAAAAAGALFGRFLCRERRSGVGRCS